MRTYKSMLAALAVCAMAAVDAAAQTTNNTGLVLEIMARRPGVTAGDFDATQFQSHIFAPAAGACGLSVSNNPPANTPAAGWRVNGRVLGTTKGPAGDQLVVEIDWERRWESGAATSQGPRGATKLTMSAGDTVVLDRIPQAAAGNCPSGDLRLVTSVVGRTEALRSESDLFERFSRGMAGARGGGTTVAGAGGRGAAGAAGAGSGTGVTSAGGGAAGGVGRATTGVTAAGGGRGGAGGGSANATAAGGATTVTRGGRGGAAGGGTFGTGRGGVGQFYVLGGPRSTSELWLVHKQPNGEERVQQLSTQFGRAGTDYSFPPVSINTARGVVTVDITGRLQVNPRPGEADPGARALYGQLLARQGGAAADAAPATPETSKIQLLISRRARSTAAALDTSGASSTAIDLPKPEEVLSFEFPALPKATEDLLAGHKFSIRLRVSPVK